MCGRVALSVGGTEVTTFRRHHSDGPDAGAIKHSIPADVGSTRAGRGRRAAVQPAFPLSPFASLAGTTSVRRNATSEGIASTIASRLAS